jgi:RING-finger-containing ubiquitin ligase
MKGEALNIVLFGVFVFFTILGFVLYLSYRLLGCHTSCWYYGTKIRMKRGKRKENTARCYTKLARERDFENSFEKSMNASIDNIDKACCLAFYWDKPGEVEELILPNSKKVTYGEFQKQTSSSSLFSRLKHYCCCCVDKFPSHPKNDTCPICLDVFTDDALIVLLSCSHGYHNRCLTEWLDSKRTAFVECPVCKHGMHVEGFEERIPLVRHYGYGRSYHFISTPGAYRNAITYL